MQRRNFLRSLTGLLPAPLFGQAGPSPPLVVTEQAMRATWDSLTFGGVTAQAFVVDVGLPSRLVAWEAAQHVPCMEIERGRLWLYSQWLETGGAAARSSGSFEPMADQQNRYTHAEVTELGPARIVLHWQYALFNRNTQRIFHGNTRAEEIYTVYPDGVMVRKVIAFPGNQNPVEGQPVVWETAEMGLIIGPGNTLENMIDPTAALRVRSGYGKSHEVRWPQENGRFKYPRGPAVFLCKSAPESRDWRTYIFRVGLRHMPEPFIVVPNRKDYFPRIPCAACGGNHPAFLVRTGPGHNRHWPGCVGEDCPKPYRVGIEEIRPELPTGHMALVSILPWVHPSWIARDSDFLTSAEMARQGRSA